MAETIFNPDAHPETDTVDGYVRRDFPNQTWVQIRDGAGTGSFPSLNQIVCKLRSHDDADNRYEFLSRAILLFNNPSISTAVSVTIEVYVPSKSTEFTATTPFDLVIVDSTPINNDDLESADYGNVGTTIYSDYVAFNSFNAGEWITFTLNAAGLAAVNATGIIKFGIRIRCDVTNTEPDAEQNKFSGVNLYTADEPGYAPKLIVVYPVDYPMAVTVGVFVLTGIAVNLLRPIINMAVTVGSFTLTGITTGLKRGWTMAVSVGSFILTGISVVLKKVGWELLTKNTTNWSNQSKNTTSFTNQSKNITNWTKQSKNTTTMTDQNKSTTPIWTEQDKS